MFGHKIKIDDALYARLQKASGVAGYSSVQEFILHILEVAAPEGGDESEEAIRQRLQGLGYID